MSVRLKLALSYAGFLMVAGILLIAVVWVFLLRYVPAEAIVVPRNVPGDLGGRTTNLFIPGRADLWRAFAPKAALMLGFLLVGGCVGGWILAGRMLSPLNRITAAARAAGSGSLAHRIRLTRRQDEFGELADTFDGMLARLESHVSEQQRFAANASHELRTPLAITQLLLEVAGKDPDRNVDDLIERLQGVNTRAIDLTEALLVLSRANQGSFTPEPVDLSLTVDQAAEALLPLAEKRGVSIETSTEAAHTSGSPALLAQLATNLIDNAIVHNLPTSGTVWVKTNATPGSATLTVENTGPKLDPTLVPTLIEPFHRGTERVHADGVGLGLAIVNSIVRAHDGTLSLSPRSDGGLVVSVRLRAVG